jgi:alpha-L-fucosidase 2
MTHKIQIPLSLAILLIFLSCSKEVEQPELKIWYKQPAADWNHALPVGNGRLGAMVFGDSNHERIQLNEDSMWPGGPDWGNSKGTPEDLEYIRTLIDEGKVHESDKEIVERFSYKSIVRSHQTLGDLFIDFGNQETENYSRWLSLDSAMATASYLLGDALVRERVFSSNPDNVLVIELSTNAEEGMDFTLALSRPEDEGVPTVRVNAISINELSMQGEVTQRGGKKGSEPLPLEYGVKFEARLQVEQEGGTIRMEGQSLLLSGTSRAIIYLVANTSFYHEDYVAENENNLLALKNKPFNEILQDHVQDYQQLFGRVELNLGGTAMDTIATDERLARVKTGSSDPDLVAKMFHYGRYLLISSSRPGTNPANLQGLWNEHIAAPWNADYHLNINLQMNYWPAEVTNLSECHQPLLDFIDRLIVRGKETAANQYGMKGAVVHHASDLWAAPWMRAERAYWGSWIHGGGWLMQHMWEHYQFTNDTLFLREQAYPAMKSIAEFYMDWLVEDENGMLVSTPETSPENSYIAEDGEPAATVSGSAMGHQIIAEVFDHLIEASDILGIEDSFTQEVRQKKKLLRSGTLIGEDGRLLEWDKDYPESEEGHRHMSHLYAFHPGNTITPQTPDLFAAVQKSLKYRLDHGGAGTGWSRAWLINFSARLLDPEAVSENIRLFLEKSTADNLFDMHPPFQIDGNFGFTAGIAEALIQSQNEVIHILPALPDTWGKGYVKGLRARGGYEVEIGWENNILKELTLTSVNGLPGIIKYNSREVQFEAKAGETIQFGPELNVLK